MNDHSKLAASSFLVMQAASPRLSQTPIGRGAYGTVYLTNDPRWVCKVYIKPGSMIEELAMYKALQDSPYIPQLNSFKHQAELGRDNWICIERFDIDLAKYKIRDTTEARQLSYRLIQAVADTHRRGIVHLDLKPSNILLKLSDMSLAICDWGSARVVGSLDNGRPYSIQTRGWRAPELLLGTGDYSTKLDMWGVGCLIYYIFTGRYLGGQLEDGEVAEVLYIFAKVGGIGPFACLPGEVSKFTFDAQLNSLLRELLQPHPRKRLSAAEALAHPFWTGYELLYPPLPTRGRPQAAAKPDKLPDPDSRVMAEIRADMAKLCAEYRQGIRTLELACRNVKYASYHLYSKLNEEERSYLEASCLELASMVCEAISLVFSDTEILRRPLVVKICRCLDYNLAALSEIPFVDRYGQAYPCTVPDGATSFYPNIYPVPIPHTDFYVIDVENHIGKEVTTTPTLEDLARAGVKRVKLSWEFYWRSPLYPRYLVYRK